MDVSKDKQWNGLKFVRPVNIGVADKRGDKTFLQILKETHETLPNIERKSIHTHVTPVTCFRVGNPSRFDLTHLAPVGSNQNLISSLLALSLLDPVPLPVSHRRGVNKVW